MSMLFAELSRKTADWIIGKEKVAHGGHGVHGETTYKEGLRGFVRLWTSMADSPARKTRILISICRGSRQRVQRRRKTAKAYVYCRG